MIETSSDITVCVCTFKRRDFLLPLLDALLIQEARGEFTYSIVVVDNDREETARKSVEQFQEKSMVDIQYFVEPRQNIALARNLAVRHARGAYVAFIDDDEVPETDWLLKLHRVVVAHGVDGALGPIEPCFQQKPPDWVVRADLFERPRHTTGHVLHWTETRTGNALIRRSVFEMVQGPFEERFGSGGEDRDFFRRAIGLGKVFVWCDEAVVWETIPAERTRLSVQLKRALLRGKASLSNPSNRKISVLKSLLVWVLYTLLLPLFFLMGKHVFLKYLIRSFDHMGKLLAFLGIDVIREKYILN